ncbi:zinc transporter [Altererythrobacter luteolus]|uniref:Zinc transporter n=1 Tax=Pontixanthobacter luteolus TaxID=295089 RepID=A0A6I4V1Q3_9SPHN|nr:zinc transporter [Pontixanthobacter luteolus]MXP47645.1 zinc transporter [Pontixanthobacter luteolus]
MMMTLLVVGVVTGALLIGAAWGVYGRLGRRTESFLVALAGGALLLSVTSELIEPSLERSPLWIGAVGLMAGASLFALIEYCLDTYVANESGGGLLAAIVADGIPENLALGVALIGAGPMETAALAGSILLSNLPEAAGGAKEMQKSGRSNVATFGMWAMAAVVLAAAAIGGNVLLSGVSEDWLSGLRCFAAGAVVASLAMEVFPKAYREKWHWVGVATALGVMVAFGLGQLGK